MLMLWSSDKTGGRTTQTIDTVMLMLWSSDKTGGRTTQTIDTVMLMLWKNNSNYRYCYVNVVVFR